MAHVAGTADGCPVPDRMDPSRGSNYPTSTLPAQCSLTLGKARLAACGSAQHSRAAAAQAHGLAVAEHGRDVKAALAPA